MVVIEGIVIDSDSWELREGRKEDDCGRKIFFHNSIYFITEFGDWGNSKR